MSKLSIIGRFLWAFQFQIQKNNCNHFLKKLLTKMECIKIVLCIDYKLFMCYNKHKSFEGELEYEYCRRTTKRTKGKCALFAKAIGGIVRDNAGNNRSL